MEVALIIAVVIIMVLSAFMLYREFQRVSERMDVIEEKSNEKDKTIGELDARVKRLEQAKRLRMPWEALEKLMHARAALNREKEERRLGMDFIENAEAWIDEVMATGTKREGQEK